MKKKEERTQMSDLKDKVKEKIDEGANSKSNGPGR